jgi:predicted DNA-binding WGR domain protein
MHEEIVRLCRFVPTIRTRRFETREEAIAAAERMAASRRKAGYVDAT